MNRYIDQLGRVVIPKEMRDKIGLKNGDEVKFEIKNEKIIISNPKTFNIKKYIEELQLDENISTESYRILEKILEKII